MYMESEILNYRVIIEQSSYEDGSTVYTATCPTLGVSDYGCSVDELLESIKDGIELALEHLRKEDKDIPQDTIKNQIITSLHFTPRHGETSTVYKTA